jgi:hypothetical protein
MGILVLAFVASMVVTVLFLRTHLVEIIVFKYKYDNTKQALQTLMSLTPEVASADGGHELKRASMIVGDYLSAIGNGNGSDSGTTGSGASGSDVEFLGDELGKMVENGIFNCYKLTARLATGEETLSESKCGTDKHTASKYRGSIPIATPDGVSVLTLAVE